MIQKNNLMNLESIRIYFLSIFSIFTTSLNNTQIILNLLVAIFTIRYIYYKTKKEQKK